MGACTEIYEVIIVIGLIMRSILLYWLFGLVDSSVIEMIIVVPISCWFDGCTYTFLGM